MLARVDDQHAFVSDQKHRIRRFKVEQEIKVGRDLPEHRLAQALIGAALGGGRGGEKQRAGNDGQNVKKSGSTSFNPNRWVVIFSSGNRFEAICSSASSQAL